MKEKVIVALLTLNITFGLYIWSLPKRPNLRPGGELFIPLFALAFWYVGHEMQKQIRADKEEER